MFIMEKANAERTIERTTVLAFALWGITNDLNDEIQMEGDRLAEAMDGGLEPDPAILKILDEIGDEATKHLAPLVRALRKLNPDRADAWSDLDDTNNQPSEKTMTASRTLADLVRDIAGWPINASYVQAIMNAADTVLADRGGHEYKGAMTDEEEAQIASLAGFQRTK